MTRQPTGEQCSVAGSSAAKRGAFDRRPVVAWLPNWVSGRAQLSPGTFLPCFLTVRVLRPIPTGSSLAFCRIMLVNNVCFGSVTVRRRQAELLHSTAFLGDE
jgi:hypothetical protein